MEGCDAREETIKGRESPKKRGWTIPKEKETSKKKWGLPCKELELSLFIRDWSSDMPKEGTILNYYSNCIYLLLWILQS